MLSPSVWVFTEKIFLNAGLVASRKKEFWDIWEAENHEAYKYVCAENDILNLIWYNHAALRNFRKKIFDKKKDGMPDTEGNYLWLHADKSIHLEHYWTNLTLMPYVIAWMSLPEIPGNIDK